MCISLIFCTYSILKFSLNFSTHINLKLFQECAKDHFRDPDTGKCIHCGCNVEGSTSSQCDFSGRCSCQMGVVGDKCDRCQVNYYTYYTKILHHNKNGKMAYPRYDKIFKFQTLGFSGNNQNFTF